MTANALASPARPAQRQGRPGYVLTLACPDQIGIVQAVAGFLVEHECNIVESFQFDDGQTTRLFMRVQFEATGDRDPQAEQLRADFLAVATRFEMTWKLLDASERQRVLIMVSKYGHCLNDLLFRASNGAMPVTVAAVVSNHPDLAPMADSYKIPFHHIPVTADTKPQAEAALMDLVDELDIDLVVLARYMQILSHELCERLDGRAINIHHSILPSFKGARPYQQAHDRGVKIIGATAHYVTPALDEGPIIEQQVARIDHAMTTAQVEALGRDTESLALAHAVTWHTQNRVMLDGMRTVVFH